MCFEEKDGRVRNFHVGEATRIVMSSAEGMYKPCYKLHLQTSGRAGFMFQSSPIQEAIEFLKMKAC